MANGDAAGDAVKQRKPRGSSGLPKGVTKSGSKYQARVNYKPEGKTRKELRGVGSFDSVEQAEQAVAAAYARLLWVGLCFEMCSGGLMESQTDLADRL